MTAANCSFSQQKVQGLGLAVVDVGLAAPLMPEVLAIDIAGEKVSLSEVYYMPTPVPPYAALGMDVLHKCDMYLGVGSRSSSSTHNWGHVIVSRDGRAHPVAVDAGPSHCSRLCSLCCVQ